MILIHSSNGDRPLSRLMALPQSSNDGYMSVGAVVDVEAVDI